MKTIGNIIKDLRIQNKMSANELAEKIGRKGTYKKQYIYDIEKGKTKTISITLINQLSDIFEIDPSLFYKGLVNKAKDEEMNIVEDMPILHNKNVDTGTKLNYIISKFKNTEEKLLSYENIIFKQEERIINLEKKIKALVTLLEVEKAMSDLLIRTKTDGS